MKLKVILSICDALTGAGCEGRGGTVPPVDSATNFCIIDRLPGTPPPTCETGCGGKEKKSPKTRKPDEGEGTEAEGRVRTTPTYYKLRSETVSLASIGSSNINTLVFTY